MGPRFPEALKSNKFLNPAFATRFLALAFLGRGAAASALLFGVSRAHDFPASRRRVGVSGREIRPEVLREGVRCVRRSHDEAVWVL